MTLEFNKRKRTEYDIIYDMLNALKNEPLLKTRLIYKSNTNYVIAKKYISYLEGKGMIIRKDKYYYITEKGLKLRNLLESYKARANDLKEILEILKAELTP